MKKKLLLAAVLLVLALTAWIVWGNTALQVTEFTITADIPAAFDGFRIAQVSDLHNAQFGENNEKLLQALADAQPDIILITGDLMDSRHTDVEAAIQFVERAVEIAPCYYCTGNHERRLPDELSRLISAMESAGVTILRNSSAFVERNGQTIRLCGIDDPDFYPYDEIFTADLLALGWDKCFTILLSHRPERFEDYVTSGVELVFSGHVHGGQFRLPLIGGLFGPHQGFFPKYDAGLYSQGGTTMVLSRGLGNSLFPFRFNNRPEVVIVTLDQP